MTEHSDSTHRHAVALRPVEPGDGDTLYDLITGTKICDNLQWNGPDSREEMVESIDRSGRETAKGERHFFVIVDSFTQQPIGSIDVRPKDDHLGDVGLWIAESSQGKGLGTAAIAQITEYGFGLGLGRIEAKIFVGNHGSRRAFEKNGYELEGTLRAYAVKQGRPVDEWLLSKLAPEITRDRGLNTSNNGE